jgi:hypothetical protein
MVLQPKALHLLREVGKTSGVSLALTGYSESHPKI